MTYPVAVAPSVRSPGVATSVNLLAGVSSPGSGARRCLLIANKSSVGTITADTEVKEAVAGPDAVETFLGTGTPGHLAAIALFAEYPKALVDLVAPAVGAGNAATGTFTFDDSTAVTVAQLVTAKIAGREITYTWAAGVADTDAADDFKDAINAYPDLPVTATVSGAVVTLVPRFVGEWANDIKISIALSDGTGGAVTASGSAMASGTLAGSLATALATVSTRKYDIICDVSSGNADGGAASTTSSPGRLKTHIDTYDSGFNAKLQQAIRGQTGTISTVKTGTAQHNYGPMQYVFCQNALSLPCEFAGAEAGARLREEATDPNVNRIRMPYVASLIGPLDPVGDLLTEVEVEDLLQSGVTPVTFDTTGTMRPERPITTYFKDAAGNADGRLLDVGQVTGTYVVANDFATYLPQRFPKAKLSRDIAPTADPPPAGVVQEKHVRLAIANRGRFWVQQGVLKSDEWEASVAKDGDMICQVNATDSSQLDLVVPVHIVPPLAKFSLVVNRLTA